MCIYICSDYKTPRHTHTWHTLFTASHSPRSPAITHDMYGPWGRPGLQGSEAIPEPMRMRPSCARRRDSRRGHELERGLARARRPVRARRAQCNAHTGARPGSTFVAGPRSTVAGRFAGACDHSRLPMSTGRRVTINARFHGDAPHDICGEGCGQASGSLSESRTSKNSPM